jgi:hypothetical protein
MISSIWEKVPQECTSVKSLEGELGTHGGPTRLEGLVSAVLRSGYPVYTKKKKVSPQDLTITMTMQSNCHPIKPIAVLEGKGTSSQESLECNASISSNII